VISFIHRLLDLGTYNAIFLNVYLYGNGNYAANPCNEVAEDQVLQHFQ